MESDISARAALFEPSGVFLSLSLGTYNPKGLIVNVELKFH